MNVFLANEQDVVVDEPRLSALAQHDLKEEGVDQEAELSVLLVARDHMQRLNSRFAGEDRPTDVLAFPMVDDDDEGVLLLGDVVVCPQIAEQNAAGMEHSVARELDTLLIHGTLHLLGYDHETPEEKERMESRLYVLLESFAATPMR